MYCPKYYIWAKKELAGGQTSSYLKIFLFTYRCKKNDLKRSLHIKTMAPKTPADVASAIKKLSASEQG
jgi:hypothetical protein